MPEAVILTLKCLEHGCDLGEPTSSVGLNLDDPERMQTAEAFVNYAARRCRNKHAAGVEARFSDDVERSIIFSKTGGAWNHGNRTTSEP